VLSESPHTLFDLTAHQLNAQGVNLPSFIALPAPSQFPYVEARLTGQLPDGRLVAYDWAASDQNRVDYPRPDSAQLELIVAIIRASLG